MIFRKRIGGLSEAAFTRFVGKASRAAKLGESVNVLITTSRELRTLNSRFRGKDKATDVLSFPPVPGSSGFGGDIAISADIAARNARVLGHSTAEEVKILALHGILHLAGYDHERDSGEMGRQERRLRKVLALPVSLIERSAETGESKAELAVGNKGGTLRRRRRKR